jgi:hypothetical protein
VYYRLRVLEPGQLAFYSAVATIQAPGAAGLVAWPTVFAAELHLDGSSLGADLLRAELLDAQGRVVRAQALPAGARTATLSGQDLAAGLYLLRVTTATQRCQQRVVRE